jgi:hypothetical protein
VDWLAVAENFRIGIGILRVQWSDGSTTPDVLFEYIPSGHGIATSGITM